jgi:hypothetical protein
MINHRIANIGALCGAIIAGVVFAGGLHLWSGGEAQADHSDSTVDLVAIDTDIAGNTATSFGDIDTCTRIEPGASLEVDVIVDAIPEDRPLTAIQFELFYDPAIVHATAIDYEMLIAANAFQAFVFLTNPLPDSDGFFLVGYNDADVNPESGPGVLTRITLTAVGTGVSNLSLVAIDLRDDHNESMPPTTSGAANVAVGQACPSEEPTPITTPPRIEPSPDEAQDQTPQPIPDLVGDAGNPTATPDPGTPDTSEQQGQQLVLAIREELLEALTAGLNLDVSSDTVSVGGSTVVLAVFADDNDAAVSGVDVSFKIEEQPGDDASLEGDLDVTRTADAEGVAEATLNVGSTPGKIIVSATSDDQTETVTVTVTEQAATEGEEGNDGDDGGGGIGAWIAAPIVAALLALAGGGYWVYRWRLQKAP